MKNHLFIRHQLDLMKDLIRKVLNKIKWLKKRGNMWIIEWLIDHSQI